MIAQTIKTIGTLGGTASALIGTTLGAVNCGLNCLNDEINNLHSDSDKNLNQNTQNVQTGKRIIRLDASKNTKLEVRYNFIKNNEGYCAIETSRDTYVTNVPYTQVNELGRMLFTPYTLRQCFDIAMGAIPERFVVTDGRQAIVLWDGGITKEDYPLLKQFVEDIFYLI